jgi:histidine triad (HIT) family protein
VIPRREIDYIFDMEDEEIAAFQTFAKKVAIAIKNAIPCIKVGEAVIGLEVRHAHIHLIPMQSEKDMVFSNPKLSLPESEMEAIAGKIRAEFEKL